jgi:beta-1,4-mannosyl-glycoprotein beta-1,4-N-acetylglucosaminyltransferase
MNADEYRDRDRIASYIRQGKDLWDREGEEYERIDNNQDIPKILLDQRKKFSDLLDRDGPNAGFEDYP